MQPCSSVSSDLNQSKLNETGQACGNKHTGSFQVWHHITGIHIPLHPTFCSVAALCFSHVGWQHIRVTIPVRDALTCLVFFVVVNKVVSKSQHSIVAMPSVPHCWLMSEHDDCLQILEAGQKLLDAIVRSLPIETHWFTIVVAAACLQSGFSSCSHGYQLVPVSCCTIGAAVKQNCPHIPGKLRANLQKCQQFFRIVPGPAGTQPAVLLVLTAMIDKPYSKAVAKILNQIHSSREHPSNGKRVIGCDSASEDSLGLDAPDKSQVCTAKGAYLNTWLLTFFTTTSFLLCMLDSLITWQIYGDCLQDLEAAQKLSDAIAETLPLDIHEFAIVVAAACLQNGFSSYLCGYQLVPVSCCTIGAVVKKKCPHIPGKLQANLQKCQHLFKILPGPAGSPPAVLPVLTAMIDRPYCKAVAKILNKLHSISEHPASGKQFAGFETASEGSLDSESYTCEDSDADV